MIEIIGLTTFCLLIGVLSMALESASERRRMAVSAAERLNVAERARRTAVSSM